MVLIIKYWIMIRASNKKQNSNEEVGGTLTGNQPAKKLGMMPKCKLVKGLVGPRSASGVVFSHGDGVLGRLRGWLVPGLRRGLFLATVMVV